MQVKHTAFCTMTALCVATGGAVFGAAATTATAAAIAYSILATITGGLSIAAMTAAFDPKSVDSDRYFETLKEHGVYAVGGMFQLFTQTLLQSVMQGAAAGLFQCFANKINPKHNS